MPFEKPGDHRPIKLTLNKFYGLRQLPPEVWCLRERKFETIYLETECVVSEPEMIIPETARYWDLTLRRVSVGNKYEFRSEAHLREILKGTGVELYMLNMPRARLYEFFSDWGSDGHINLTFVGYVIMLVEDYDREVKTYNGRFKPARDHMNLLAHKLINYDDLRSKHT